MRCSTTAAVAVLWLCGHGTLAVHPVEQALQRVTRTTSCVSVWHAREDSPGEPGAGWASGDSSQHRAPRTIVLVGTSHIIGAEESARLVHDVVDAVKPDAVVVELCRSRTGLMFPETTSATPFGISGPSTEPRSKSVARSLALGGSSSLLLRLLLARTAAGVASDAGLDRYADFRAARVAAEAVNATLVLGDRPVEITLERAWLALSWAERLRLLYLLAAPVRSSAPEAGAAADLSTRVLDESTTIDDMASLMGGMLPGLREVLIRERDIYLSLTCKASRAVDGAECVVGVVGRGHLDGVRRALDEDHAGAFKALTWTPRRARAKQRVLGVPAPIVDRLVVDGGVLLVMAALLNTP